MRVVPVILAGGIGERFWPFSRSSTPKQLLPIVTDKPMIEETFVRAKELCIDNTKPVLVTGSEMAEKIDNLLKDKYDYYSIKEKVGKNTAPAVAIAAKYIEWKYGSDVVMAVLSADHAIEPVSEFVRAMEYAVKIAASEEALVVFGIKPSRPDTGYGYVNIIDEFGKENDLISYNVKRFVEKPDVETAQKYYESGEYFWNSGMFVWRASVILKEFEKSMPQIYELLDDVVKNEFSQSAVDNYYEKCIKESVDFGIMEKASRVIAVVGKFNWSDVGSWESIYRMNAKEEGDTVTRGDNVFVGDCKNSLVINNNPNLTLGIFGADNLVVVAVNDAVMVIPREKLPYFKEYLTEMKKSGKYKQELF